MDRNEIENGVEELGIASVETLGSVLPYPEPDGISPFPLTGIAAD